MTNILIMFGTSIEIQMEVWLQKQLMGALMYLGGEHTPNSIS